MFRKQGFRQQRSALQVELAANATFVEFGPTKLPYSRFDRPALINGVQKEPRIRSVSKNMSRAAAICPLATPPQEILGQ